MCHVRCPMDDNVFIISSGTVCGPPAIGLLASVFYMKAAPAAMMIDIASWYARLMAGRHASKYVRRLVGDYTFDSGTWRVLLWLYCRTYDDDAKQHAIGQATGEYNQPHGTGLCLTFGGLCRECGFSGARDCTGNQMMNETAVWWQRLIPGMVIFLATSFHRVPCGSIYNLTLPLPWMGEWLTMTV